jgi:anti-anti-sigma factor
MGPDPGPGGPPFRLRGSPTRLSCAEFGGILLFRNYPKQRFILAVAPFSNPGERFIMSISYDDIGDNLRRIVITGRLDMPGTDSVASRLEELIAAPKKGVVVDLSSVRFLASIGIRALITSAKAVQQRGGKMVLVVDGGSSVLMSLEATGVDQLIPVFRNAADAEKAAVA